jgi:hypothetical protein
MHRQPNTGEQREKAAPYDIPYGSAAMQIIA